VPGLLYNPGVATAGPKFRLVSADRRAELKVLRKSVEPIFRNRLHAHYTDHSIIHCDRVAELAEKLLAPLKKSAKLNDDEGFVLYASCYLHDIGMHNEKAGESGRLADSLKATARKWSDIQQDERLDLIRQYHH
jgi:HD superfamily phosphodiesterase